MKCVLWSKFICSLWGRCIKKKTTGPVFEKFSVLVGEGISFKLCIMESCHHKMHITNFSSYKPVVNLVSFLPPPTCPFFILKQIPRHFYQLLPYSMMSVTIDMLSEVEIVHLNIVWDVLYCARQEKLDIIIYCRAGVI